MIDDSIEVTSSTIATKCWEVIQEEVALGLVVVDSIQLVRELDQPGERHNIRASARALKALAVELSVPIVILSQISGGPEDRENHRPVSSDCPIGDEADVIILIYRDEYYDPESTARGEADIIIARNKRGVTGTVTLRFDGRTRNFLSPPVREFILECES